VAVAAIMLVAPATATSMIAATATQSYPPSIVASAPMAAGTRASLGAKYSNIAPSSTKTNASASRPYCRMSRRARASSPTRNRTAPAIASRKNAPAMTSRP